MTQLRLNHFAEESFASVTLNLSLLAFLASIDQIMISEPRLYGFTVHITQLPAAVSVELTGSTNFHQIYAYFSSQMKCNTQCY